MTPAIQVGIITVSDRAAAGEYEDLGGPALRAEAARYGWTVAAEAIVPDEASRIQEAIRAFGAADSARPAMRHVFLGRGVRPRAHDQLHRFY